MVFRYRAPKRRRRRSAVRKAHPGAVSEWRALHRIAAGGERSIQQIWEELGRGGMSRSVSEQVVRSQVTARQSVQDVFDLLKKDHLEALEGPLEDVGKRAASKIDVGLRFDLLNPAAVRAAQEHVGKLIVEVSDDQVAAIRGVISRHIVAGSDIPTAARAVRRTVGLHSRFANAVENLRERQVAVGIRRGLTDAAARKRAEGMADSYARRLLRSRATSIARTESLWASNAGQRMAWDQAAKQGFLNPAETFREWVIDPNQAKVDVCTPLDGTRVALKDEFPDGDPPLHTRCECTHVLAFEDPEGDAKARSGRGGASKPSTGPGRPARAPKGKPSKLLERDGFNPAQEEAWQDYVGQGYREINDNLRGLSRAPLEAIHKTSIDTMDGIMKVSRMPKARSLYRSANANIVGDARVGSVITDQGFISTTTRELTDVASGNVRMIVRAKRGQAAMRGSAKEAELILPRGSSFRVVDVVESLDSRGESLRTFVLEVV